MDIRATKTFNAILAAAVFLLGGLMVTSTAEAQAPGCAAVERELAYGEAAMQDAKNRSGYLKAANQYRAAIKKAPNCAAAHFNLGVAYEKAGRLSSAKAAFQTYLKLAPGAKDAAKVRKSIFKLEYRIKEAGRTRRAAKKKPRQTRKAKTAAKPSPGWAGFAGRWCYSPDCNHPRRGTPDKDYTVTISGSQIKITQSFSSANVKNSQSFTGTIDPSGAMRGAMRSTSYIVWGRCAGSTFVLNRASFTGSTRNDIMRPDGRTIRGSFIVLSWRAVDGGRYDYRGCRFVPRGGWQRSMVLKKR